MAKRLISFLRRTATPQKLSSSAGEEPKTRSWGQKAVSGVLICLTGGVALSALDDLVIFGGCSTKAMEKASKNQAIIDAIGEPVVRGPWYNASLAVAQKRNSVSCSFPVSGPQGTGTLQLKAVRIGGKKVARLVGSRPNYQLATSKSKSKHRQDFCCVKSRQKPVSQTFRQRCFQLRSYLRICTHF